MLLAQRVRTPLLKIHAGFCYPLGGSEVEGFLKCLTSPGGDSWEAQLRFKTPTPTSPTTTHPVRVGTPCDVIQWNKSWFHAAFVEILCYPWSINAVSP